MVTVPIVNASSFGGLHSAEAAKEQAVARVEAEQSNLVAAERESGGTCVRPRPK
jgi:hypothetical protein